LVRSDLKIITVKGADQYADHMMCKIVAGFLMLLAIRHRGEDHAKKARPDRPGQGTH